MSKVGEGDQGRAGGNDPGLSKSLVCSCAGGELPAALACSPCNKYSITGQRGLAALQQFIEVVGVRNQTSLFQQGYSCLCGKVLESSVVLEE